MLTECHKLFCDISLWTVFSIVISCNLASFWSAYLWCKLVDCWVSCCLQYSLSAVHSVACVMYIGDKTAQAMQWIVISKDTEWQVWCTVGLHHINVQLKLKKLTIMMLAYVLKHVGYVKYLDIHMWLRDCGSTVVKLRDYSSTVVKAPCYKLESCWFDPSWCQWIFHWHKILPIALWPWGRLDL